MGDVPVGDVPVGDVPVGDTTDGGVAGCQSREGSDGSPG